MLPVLIARLLASHACELPALAELSPALPQAHARLGELLARQGRWQEAEAALREALRLQPDDARLRIALGGVLRRLGG